MKNKIAAIALLMFLACFSTGHAYSYSFNILTGSATLNIPADYSEIFLQTTEDLVVDLTADTAPENILLDYAASFNIELELFNGFINFPLSNAGFDLGQFASFNITDIVNPSAPVTHMGNLPLEVEFPPYSLEGASVFYHFTITPDMTVSDRYSIDIPMLMLSGGNTDEVLSALLTNLSINLPSPIENLPVSLTGQVDIEATPTPVPSALWLLGSGLLGLVGWKRRG